MDEVHEVTSDESLTDWRLLNGDFLHFYGKRNLVKIDRKSNAV